MGVDTAIDFPCLPKEHLTTQDIVDRLKGRDRAQKIIQYYREQGDYRPENEIGFEMTRRSADGAEVTELVLASSLMDSAAELQTLSQYCEGCPANRAGKAFGCVGYINYPISRQAEIWMLKQLPGPEYPVLFLMLQKGVTEFGYTGATARGLRDQRGVFFETMDTLGRQFPEFTITTDSLFEMTFMLGPIQPGHAAMLLLFYGAIPREEIDPAAIIALSGGSPERAVMAEQFPFQLEFEQDDDHSIRDIKNFLRSLYLAYKLDVALLLDV
jgi:hypothetical protein